VEAAMEISEIQDRIAAMLSSDKMRYLWDTILEGASPPDYAYKLNNVHVDKRDIWLDVSEEIFSFKNLAFQFEVQRASSDTKSGGNEQISRQLSGSGVFRIKEGGRDIRIKNVAINERLDFS
jgi:hypothetical protein